MTTVLSKQNVRGLYLHSLLWAAFAFALAHASEVLIYSTDDLLAINPTSLITLAFAGLAEYVVFVVVGGLIAYIPVLFLYRTLGKFHRVGTVLYVTTGIIVGTALVPFCAIFGYLLGLYIDDGPPDYLSICETFALPMTIAGATGGLVFWRSDRKASEQGSLVAEEFS